MTNPAYIAEVTKRGHYKVLNRLMLLRFTSLQMFDENEEEMQAMVRRQMKEDNMDMPEYLSEASEMMGEEEAKHYCENYRKQV